MAKATSPRANDPNDELKTLRARVAKLEAREEKYKKAAETFRDAERRFRQLAAAASEGVVISEAGIILDANDQFARIFGYKRAELVGTSMLDLVVPEDRDAVRGHVAEMFEGRYEYRGVRRDGAVLTLEVRGKPIPYEGRTVRITAIADVTERKRADEGLRASEQRYRRLFEAARDGVLILDAATGKIIDANPFLTQILGYTRKDLIGKELWEIGVLADNRANRLAFAELQRDKYIRYEDLPLQAKDGHIVDVEFVSNVYQVGGQEVIQCNIRDISERKAAEDALRDAEARLRAVITNTPVVLYALDENGTFTLFEGAGAKTAGYKPGELVGLNVFEDLADQPYLHECIRRALAGHEHDCTIPGRKGRLFDMRFTPVRDEKKRVVGVTAVGVDITAAVEAEKALQASAAELSAIFRGTPVIMALVDGERRVRKINRDGVAFAGRPETELLGLRGGDVLRCLHALDDPRGCGFGQSCVTCAIRNATLESLDTGKPIRQRPMTFEVNRDGRKETLALLISATPLALGDGKAALLTLEDVTDLEQARAEAETRRSETAALFAASRAVLEQENFTAAARTIFDAAKNALGADNGFITLISPEGILVTDSYLDVGGGVCDIPLPAVNCIHGLSAEVARTRIAAYENDFPRSPSHKLLPPGHMPMANVLVAPLVLEGETVGLLALGNKPGGFAASDLDLANGFAKIAAVALLRFRAQDQLAVSETRYRFAQEAAGIGAWDWDVRAGRIYWSPVTERLHGFSPGKFDGSMEQAASRLHPEDAAVNAVVNKAVAAGQPYDASYRIVWPDGTVRWLRSAADCITNGAGEVVRVVGVTWDVTAEKEAAKVLAENEKQLRDIVDTSFATIVLVEAGSVVYANKRITEIFGYGAAEADGLAFTAFFPAGEGERVTQLIRTETEYGGEHRGAKKDGTPMWLRVRARPLEYRGKQVQLVYLIDITSLHDALEAARASEERYALAQRAADIGSWDWNVATGDLLWSETIEPMFGFAPGQFGGTYEAFLASVHPDDRDAVVSAVNAAGGGKQPYDIEHRVVWPDGTVRWVSEKGEVFHDAGGTAARMLGIVRDITARKKAQEELKLALAEAEQRRAEMAALLDAAGAVLEVPHFEAAAEAIFKGAKNAVGAAAGYVALLNADGTENDVVFLDPGDYKCTVDPNLPMPIRGFREVAIRTQKAVYENDFLRAPWMHYMPPGHTPLQNVLFAPLIIEGQTVGLLGLGNKPGGFSPNDALLAAAFADFAAVALQNYRNLDKLEASEERYRRIVETAEEGIWVLDENNNTVFVNHKMAGMLGYGVAEMVGQPFLKFIDGGVLGVERGEELRRRGVVEQRDVKLRRRDGNVLWGISVMSPIFDENGRYAGALTMLTDITERKQAEDALREAEVRYRSIFEQSPDGVLIIDPATMKPLEFNETAARQLGYTMAEFTGIAVTDYEAQESADETRARVENIVRHGRDDFETQHRTKSGSTLNVFVTTKLVELEGRKLLYTIFRDLTPLKRAEEKLVETAAELARSNQDLEQFAYAASHDLKEPLRMVTSYLQLLEKRYGDRLDGDAVEFLNYAVDGARRMGMLIQDLLDYSRVSTRGKPFRATDLNAVMDVALSDLQLAIEESGAAVTHDELPTVAADSSQMRQLFQNLLGNAIKFRGDAPPRVHVGVRRQDGEWAFSFRDNGIGIAPEYHDRVFGVFQRLHGRSEYPGTGIGLAICEKIVSRHGGRIWVESEPGLGATFFFSLPERGEEV